MRHQERGIGNLAFIAVLVLFVIALAMFFVTKDEADTAKQKRDELSKTASEAQQQRVDAENAYDALIEVTGLALDGVQRSGGNFPEPDQIKTTTRAWLMQEAEKIRAASELTLSTKNYQVPQGNNVITEVAGDTARVTLFGVTLGQETITFKAMIDPLADQFSFAAKVARENNDKFETTVETMRGRVGELDSSAKSRDQKYNADVTAKTQQAEGFQQQLQETRDTLQNQTAKVDAMESELAQTKADKEREVRLLKRENTALQGRIVNEKVKKAIALEEDPKDGEVIEASRTLGTVWIDRGRKHRVSRGTKFTVWQPGKGNVREDIAVIRVINVDQTRSEARIVKQIDARRPVTRGMNISNPFYDANKDLTVFIAGDLRRYTTDTAKRRLAASGVRVVPKLDIGVDIIVLGEAPVAGGGSVEEEEDAAAAERMRAIQADKRLKEIMDMATSIGAVVVTEDVLATFIDY